MQRIDDTNKAETAKQSSPLVKIVGAAGAGKSAFLNYMLRHEFVKEREESEDSEESEESEQVQVANQNETFEADGYTYSESPALELPIKAVILVLSVHHFYTANSYDMFLTLGRKLRSIVDMDDIKPNFIFIFNSMGDARYTYPAYIKMLNEYVRSRKSDMRDLDKKIAGLEEFYREDSESLVVGRYSLFKTPRKTIDVLQEQRELKSSLEATIKLLSYISNSNSVVWSSHLNQGCRDEVLTRLNQMERVLSSESKIGSEGVIASPRR